MISFVPFHRIAILALLTCISVPTSSQAGRVCPPQSLEEPLPGVREVTLTRTSVSTARFPGLWQDGKYGPAQLSYRLFQDGSGSVAQDLKLRGWHVDFSCDLETRTCTYEGRSSPPGQAFEAAKAIGDCLVAEPPRSKKRPVILPAKAVPLIRPARPGQNLSPDKVAVALKVAPARQKDSTPAPNRPVAGPDKKATAATGSGDGKAGAKPAASNATVTASTKSSGKPVVKATGKGSSPAAPPATLATKKDAPPEVRCWADWLPDEPVASRLQRMLLLAGFDAGPVDGHIGRRTQKALRLALPDDPKRDEMEEAVVELRKILCDRPVR